ncbi:MAG: translation initiation factor IF-2 [Pseudomonadota bacterium]
MSDNVDTKSKSEGRKPLTLRKTETGAVKQSFSHGRTKTVVVEKKRRRPNQPEPGATTVRKAEPAKPAAKKATAEKPAPTVEKKTPPRSAAASAAAADGAKRKGAVLRTLSDDEKKARAVALQKAKKDSNARKAREDEERKAREAREAEERARLEDERKRQAEEDEKRAKEAEERAKAEEEARQQLEAEDAVRKAKRNSSKTEVRDVGEKVRDEKAGEPRAADPEDPLAQLGGRIKTKRSFGADRQDTAKKAEPRRRTGKLTIANALDDDERQRSLASVRRAREKEKLARQQRSGGREQVLREVIIPDTITVTELAQRMAMRAVDLIKAMMKQGQMVTANDILDADTAQLIAEDLGHQVKRVSESDVEEGLGGAADDEADLAPRPPVVTIMGHVDHGKTSLLDAMRNANVVDGEAGGITQHIGAYQIETNGQKITFLDTPGHAAFTQMRARGAKVTDIVIIVVAADDSVMPQTIEAISHAKAAGVPIIIAINKVDKPDADANKVRTDLLQHEIQVESMGGEIQDVEVSAMQKLNLDGLQDAILLQSELLELKANPKRAAEGAVVEAQLDKGRGPIATLLVQCGSLKRGDVFVCGAEWGKVRALVDDKGKQLKEAGPALPVEVLGLNGVPEPGDQFVVVENEARAREVAEFRQRKKREKTVAKSAGTSLEQMMAQLKDAELNELPIVIKGDVQGSVEAIIGSLDKLATEEVRVKILHSGVGGISESDVILAEASGAPVIGFNVRANKDARIEAERSGVEIRYYSVIYDLIDDLKDTLSGMLSPEIREEFIGNAEILEVFNITKVGKVAGCRVVEGRVKRGAKVRLIRDSVVIHEGTLSQLKRFKDDVDDVPMGQECGMSFANYDDLKVGDTIECFDVQEIQRTL